MTEWGCVQVGVHGACMKAQRGTGEVLIDDTSLWMRIEHLVDGSIDLLTHVPTEPLPRRAARRRKLCLRHPLLLKAGAQFSFVSALVPIVAMFASQCAMERPVALTRRGRDEVGDATIYSHHRSSRCRLKRNLLIEGEREPPDSLTFGERGGGVHCVASDGLFLVHSPLDRNPPPTP